MLSGDLSFLALVTSSRDITSRHQCSWFSIDQCFLTALAISPVSVSEVMEYHVASRSSAFSYTIDFTAPTDMRFFHSSCYSSHEISVSSLYSRCSIRPCPLSIAFIRSVFSPNVSKYSATSLYMAGFLSKLSHNPLFFRLSYRLSFYDSSWCPPLFHLSFQLRLFHQV